MYKNIGKKIKWMAKIYCLIGVVASVIGGLSVMVGGASLSFLGGLRAVTWYMVLAGIVVMAVGSFISWISSFFVYGFGQLIENSDVLADKERNRRF